MKGRPAMPSAFRTLTMGLIASAALGAAHSAVARPLVSTRVVKCAEGDCLLVKGQRADPGAVVRINGHAVPASGARTWRARLPVETLRTWSEPYARTIAVSIGEASRGEVTREADLPIGLLGHSANLAMITVRLK